MNLAKAVAGGAALAAAAVMGFGAATLPESSSSTSPPPAMGCNDWLGSFTQEECFGAGTIRIALANLQPAAQFCKWKAANPGEWSRLRALALTPGGDPAVVTWLGASVRDELLAYQALGAPAFELQLENPPPNACTGKLVAPPKVQGVTPAETDVTVTVTS